MLVTGTGGRCGGGVRRDGCRVRVGDAGGLRSDGTAREGGREAVSAENVIGLALAVLLTLFLLVALLFPERF